MVVVVVLLLLLLVSPLLVMAVMAEGEDIVRVLSEVLEFGSSRC